MSRNKRLVIWLWIALLCLACAACGTGGNDDDDTKHDAIDDDDDTIDDDDNDNDTSPPPPVGGTDYILIGPQALLEAAEPLAEHHAVMGKNVWSASLEEIAPTTNAEERARLIREYLQSAYDAARRQYVLLVGDHQTIPAVYMDPDPTWPGLYAGLSDVYYGDLAGDFDFDGDGRYGEWEDDVYDYVPEMFVGRLPFHEPERVHAVAEQSVAFALEDADHKWDTLLAAGNISIPGDAAIIMEAMVNWIVAPGGYGCWRMYEAGGFIEPDGLLDHENFVERVASHPPGMTVWASHGNAACASAGEPFVCNTDAESFAANPPGVMMSSGCRNADLSVYDNLGASLLGSGAVAFVGSTTTTDPGMLGEGSLVFLTMVDRALNGNLPLAEALAVARGRYMELFFQPDGFYDVGLFWMNFFGFTLLGDPALRYWAEEPAER
ncbi:MAG: C25 family cysteine peptidase [Candidatus Lernaella stagnicola]|nr:C25 family cysteine peptidase [Candidatus Lernaella stagnicola]